MLGRHEFEALCHDGYVIHRIPDKQRPTLSRDDLDRARVCVNACAGIADAAAALAAAREALKKRIWCQRCDGQGDWELDCTDPQCGDSTWDHYCTVGSRKTCPDCKGSGNDEQARAALEGLGGAS